MHVTELLSWNLIQILDNVCNCVELYFPQRIWLFKPNVEIRKGNIIFTPHYLSDEFIFCGLYTSFGWIGWEKSVRHKRNEDVRRACEMIEQRRSNQL